MPPPLGGLLAEIQAGKSLKKTAIPAIANTDSAKRSPQNSPHCIPGSSAPQRVAPPPSGGGLMAELIRKQKQINGEEAKMAASTPPIIPAQRQGPPAIPVQRQGPPAIPVQRQGPPAIPVQRQGPPAVPAQRQGPPAIPVQRQGPPAIPVQRQGPPAVPAQRQGPPAVPAQRQGPPAIPVQRQGPPAIPVQRQGPPAVPAQRQGPPAIPVQRQGPPAIPVQRQGPPAVPAQRQGPPAIPVQRQGPPAIPVQRQGPPAIPVQRQGPPAVPAQRQGPPAIPVQRQGPPAIPVQRQGPPAIPVQRQGPPTIPVQRQGPPAVPVQRQGPLAIPVQRQGPPAIPVQRQEPPAVSVQRQVAHGASFQMQVRREDPPALPAQRNKNMIHTLNVSNSNSNWEPINQPDNQKPTTNYSLVKKFSNFISRAQPHSTESKNETTLTSTKHSQSNQAYATTDVGSSYDDEPTTDHQKHAVVRFTFVAENDDELSCEAGEKLSGYIPADDPEWFRGTTQLGSSGLIPLSYIEFTKSEGFHSPFLWLLECLRDLGTLNNVSQIFLPQEGHGKAKGNQTLDELKHLSTIAEVQQFVQKTQDPHLLALCIKLHFQNCTVPVFNLAACARAVRIETTQCSVDEKIANFRNLVEDFVKEPFRSEVNVLFQVLGNICSTRPSLVAHTLGPALFREFNPQEVMQSTKSANRLVELMIMNSSANRSPELKTQHGTCEVNNFSTSDSSKMNSCTASETHSLRSCHGSAVTVREPSGPAECTAISKESHELIPQRTLQKRKPPPPVPQQRPVQQASTSLQQIVPGPRSTCFEQKHQSSKSPPVRTVGYTTPSTNSSNPPPARPATNAPPARIVSSNAPSTSTAPSNAPTARTVTNNAPPARTVTKNAPPAASTSRRSMHGPPPRRPSNATLPRSSIVPAPSLTKVEVAKGPSHSYSCPPPPPIRGKPVV